MKFVTVSALVAIALCSFMLVHTALGESNLMKVLKGPKRGAGKGGYACFRKGRRGVYRWPVAYYKTANGASSGNYINIDKLQVSKDGSQSVYRFDCDGEEAGTGLCKDVKNEDLGAHYCKKCSFTGTKEVNMMQGGILNENEKSGKLNIRLFLSCTQYKRNNRRGPRARYTYRVEHSGSRRRRLLGMTDRDADCRL